ncbi:MAG: hypothetical protein NPIRA01_16790 [Nitrospirales bacterium]|nr:MAG: hypothetical protein NPIRA01_16790 [Nitrospirales bacterium]
MINAASARVIPNFYRTAAGAEIDLVLEFPGGKVWAIEIKHGLAPRPSKSLYHARMDVKPARSFVLYGGTDRYPLTEDVEAISLYDMAQELHQLR